MKILLFIMITLILMISFLGSSALFPIAEAHSGDTLSSWAFKVPAIDGTLSAGEWNDAASVTVTLVSQTSESHSATIYEKNDAVNLYLAVRVLGDDFNTQDGVFFYFDNNHNGNGAMEQGDDWLYLLAWATGRGLAVDGYYDANLGTGTYVSDDSYQGTNDIVGSASHSNIGAIGDYTFELTHPLDTTDDAHDFSLKLGDTVGVRMEFDDAFPGGARARTGDLIFYSVQVRTSDYFAQYWHSLNNSFITGWIFNSSYQGVGSFSFNYESDLYRIIWNKNQANFAAGNWIIIITGTGGVKVRASQLQSGDEERQINTPFQVFESFDFDFQAKCFQVTVSPCVWFAIIPRTQMNSACYMRIFSSNIQNPRDISLPTTDSNQMGYWKNPQTGEWLVILDGNMNGNVSLTFFSSTDPAPSRYPGNYNSEQFGYYGEARHYNIDMSSSPFIGLDDMCLADTVHSYLYLINPAGDASSPTDIATRFNVNHYLLSNPANGTWYLIIIGTVNSNFIYKITIAPDETQMISFSEQLVSDSDGKTTYVAFNSTGVDPLLMNFTCNSDISTWIWLYDSNFAQEYQYHFTKRNQMQTKSFPKPSSGMWYACVVQEIYGNLTIDCGGVPPPPPKPSGLLISFVYPPDAQLYLVDGNLTVLPEVNGTINVVVNVTDYYYQIVDVQLYYNSGINHTSMTYNAASKFYESLLSTTSFSDGLYELVVYARSQAQEIGIGSVTVRFDNQGTYPTIDDKTPPIIQNITQDPASNIATNQKTTIGANVADRDTAVALVLLSYSTDNGQTWQNITMCSQNKLYFQASIPGFPAGTVVTYSIMAYDYIANCAIIKDAGDYHVGVPPLDTTPPIANAGPDQTVNESTVVQFDGSGSIDNVGIVSYVWTFVDGTSISLVGIAPNYLSTNPGVYTVNLNVTDAAGNWNTDTMTFTVVNEFQTISALTLLILAGTLVITAYGVRRKRAR
jgi:hypothetical protein